MFVYTITHFTFNAPQIVIWVVCTKVLLRPVRNKVHPFKESGMECDIVFVFYFGYNHELPLCQKD